MEQGIDHLVSLSPEKIPPHYAFPDLQVILVYYWSIRIELFTENGAYSIGANTIWHSFIEVVEVSDLRHFKLKCFAPFSVNSSNFSSAAHPDPSGGLHGANHRRDSEVSRNM